MVRIFKVIVEYQETRNGRLLNKDFAESTYRVIAKDAEDAIGQAKKLCLAEETTCGDEENPEVTNVYRNKNAKALSVEFILETDN
jgi:hypothetical protein